MSDDGFSYYLLDVFCDRPFAGNPLAVFPEAETLPERHFARIANELNLSETVFVLGDEDGGPRIRIFTPGSELDFAGHPTLGTAVLLAHLGRTPTVLHENVGPVPVRVDATGGEFTAAVLPTARPATTSPDLLAVLGLDADRADPHLAPVIVESGGPRFTAIPLADRDALAEVVVDLAVWRQALAGSDAPELYPYVRTGDRELHSRMLAPGLGIPEDPATGSAAVAIAAVLYGLGDGDATSTWTIHQGVDMGRPSRIEVHLDGDGTDLAEVRIGGRAVVIGEGRLTNLD